MSPEEPYEVRPIGWVRSRLARRLDAPKQGHEGAPDAWVEVLPEFAAGLGGLSAGQEVLLLTWLHEAERTALEVRPRDDPRRPLAGVFSTRSADRPNPVGLHCVCLRAVLEGRWVHVSGLEAIDGTPVIDIKPVLVEAEGGGLAPRLVRGPASSTPRRPSASCLVRRGDRRRRRCGHVRPRS